MESKLNTEEIDLIHFFSLIKKQVVKLVQLHITNIKTILAFMLIASSAGVTLYYTKKPVPVYNSSLILSHNRVQNEFCAAIFQNLNAEIQVNNSQSQRNLGLTSEQLALIKNIEYVSLSSRLDNIYTDSVKQMTPFKITASVYDVAVLDTLQTAIYNYCENNIAAKKQKEFDQNQIRSTNAKIEHELVLIDSLKKLINLQLLSPNVSNNGSVSIASSIPVATMYGETMKILREQAKVNAAQFNINSFEIIVEFCCPTLQSHSVTIYLIVSVLIGYLVALIVLGVRSSKA
jgi:hypothetical protein